MMSEEKKDLVKDYSFRPPMLTQLIHIKNKKTGLIEVIDVKSEEIVAVQEEHGGPYREAGSVPSLYIYNHSKADEICQLIVDGAGLSEISRRSDMPSMSIIDVWRKNHPDFMDRIIRAYHLRGEYRMDRAMSEVYNMTDKQSAVVAEKRANLLLRGAGFDDPSRFNQKNDVNGHGGTTIVVNTGIQREEKFIGGSNDNKESQGRVQGGGKAIGAITIEEAKVESGSSETTKSCRDKQTEAEKEVKN